MAKHIVTTDDDPAIRKILQILLKKEGYQVTLCTNGNELLDLLKTESESIDLILLDIKMPGPSGFEVLESIRHRYPSIPVVMLTAFSDLDTGMKAMRLGASDYLAKPVLREALISCVERVIDKSTVQKLEFDQKNNSLANQRDLQEQLRSALLTLKNTTLATLEAFSETIEQKDAYTKGHCNRVRNISVAMGKALNFSHENILTLEGGSLLHDIGKIGISEEILNKTTSLTKEEYEIIKMHPVFGDRIINHIELFQPYRPIIRSHHERIDGKGYPDGLKGDQIPLEVRIVTLADAYDAMTSSRAYRSALPTEIALEELKLCSGSQFDPDLVNLFIDKEIFLL
ncbi:response regulator containing a CheY-like receiver domain and an HD-GYP domain [Sphaerochaeta pleomorpha str. Grapes]|uniref:Response regulator containing a CheY-like receiver domain and an HD-GYP domain n=1 Tax=Sphaerochaeta pleomorpha (strain ATCC BAA-1885 / DSM 22778 / Grapes) TaxID=158190 RepID=G8QSV8_SPHPG|nr:HD domain-containing phosphohydrolase [Sphaerochaeta pleomorpha]AEV30140.1 response regulator containing a CheY-like receiver domain and an HD-GYP domain [Sphaerochaeta pleomorpha str. Grapes]